MDNNAWEFELDNGKKGTLITDKDLNGARHILNTQFHHRKVIALEKIKVRK